MVSLLATRSVQVKQVQRTKRELKTDKTCIFSGQNVSRKRTKCESKPDKTCIPILVVIELFYNCLYSCYIVVIKHARALACLCNCFEKFKEHMENYCWSIE